MAYALRHFMMCSVWKRTLERSSSIMALAVWRSLGSWFIMFRRKLLVCIETGTGGGH